MRSSAAGADMLFFEMREDMGEIHAMAERFRGRAMRRKFAVAWRCDSMVSTS